MHLRMVLGDTNLLASRDEDNLNNVNVFIADFKHVIGRELTEPVDISLHLDDLSDLAYRILKMANTQVYISEGDQDRLFSNSEGKDEEFFQHICWYIIFSGNQEEINQQMSKILEGFEEYKAVSELNEKATLTFLIKNSDHHILDEFKDMLSDI